MPLERNEIAKLVNDATIIAYNDGLGCYEKTEENKKIIDDFLLRFGTQNQGDMVEEAMGKSVDQIVNENFDELTQ
jgi:hypothetical protein